MDTITVSIITFIGTVASVGGVALFVFNGTRKLVYEISQTTKELAQTTKGLAETTKELAETTKGIKEIVIRQTETLNKQTEMLNKQTEMLNRQTEMLKKMDEKIDRQIEIANHIAQLVVEESRINRELLLRIDSKISSKSDYIVREK